MREIEQTKFGKKSNALEACLASLLNVELKDVPVMRAVREEEEEEEEDEFDEFDSEEAKADLAAVNDFLRAKAGVMPLAMSADLVEMLEAPLGQLGHYLLRGAAGEADEEWEHFVVCRAGVVVHNPHPGKQPIVRPLDYIFFLALDLA
jgi:hypothetical protein